ncbi:MAG: AAA family ATPase [Candidatus Aenigmatarchaeota archaeon]
MLIQIKNHDVIEDSELEIKPLTIFLGENGTYKSYIAQLIYAAVNLETVLAIKIIEHFQNKSVEFEEIVQFYASKFKEIIQENLAYKDAPEIFLKDSKSIWQYLTITTTKNNNNKINDEIFSHINVYKAVYVPYFRTFITYFYEIIKQDNELINLINKNILHDNFPYKKVILDFLHILRNIQINNSDICNYELSNKLEKLIREHNSESLINNVMFIMMYLKKYPVKNKIFIIEEPEISLHPKTQIVFLDILLDIVNMGGHVLLITHSDYIFARINNLILNRKSVLSNSININPNEVSFYLFKKEKEQIKIKNLVDNNGYISDENFSEVLDKMIEEASGNLL